MLYNNVQQSFGPSDLPSELQNTVNRFKSIGRNVQISDKAVFYNPENISIGDNSRIDDFALLSAGPEGIQIGRYVHIACYACIIGQGKVVMEDYSAISAKVSVFSSTDPYDGKFMTNPTVPEKVRKTKHGSIYIGRHTVVGAGSVIIPDTFLPDGCAVGALSLVIGTNFHKSAILAGIPAKEIRTRATNIFELEKLTL